MSTAGPMQQSRWEAQRTFDQLGRPLRDLTFCVVDLETTGGSAQGGSMITEIGAVKVRAGGRLRGVPTPGQPPPANPAVFPPLPPPNTTPGAPAPPPQVPPPPPF